MASGTETALAALAGRWPLSLSPGLSLVLLLCWPRRAASLGQEQAVRAPEPWVCALSWSGTGRADRSRVVLSSHMQQAPGQTYSPPPLWTAPLHPCPGLRCRRGPGGAGHVLPCSFSWLGAGSPVTCSARSLRLGQGLGPSLQHSPPPIPHPLHHPFFQHDLPGRSRAGVTGSWSMLAHRAPWGR